MIVGQLPLEGENTDITPKSPSSQKATIKDIDESDTPIAPDHLGDIFEAAEPEGQGKQIWKEAAYVRRLREGEGVIDARPNASLLPEGLQEVVEAETEARDLAEEGSDDRGMIDVVEEFAMTTAIGGAEGLELNFDKAQKHSDWPQWEATIHAKIKSLNDNGTWTMVECPPGANVVDSHCVLHIKENAAGEIKKYKACLVAKGFTQIYGVNFYETYAPVA